MSMITLPNVENPTAEDVLYIREEWDGFYSTLRTLCERYDVPTPPNPADTLAPLGVRPQLKQSIDIHQDDAAPLRLTLFNTGFPEEADWLLQSVAIGEYAIGYDAEGRPLLETNFDDQHVYGGLHSALFTARRRVFAAATVKAAYEQEREIVCTQEDGLITYSVEGRDANLSIIVDERARQVSGFTVKDTLMNGVTTVIDSEIETLIALLQTALRRSRYGRIARAKQA